MWLRSTRAAAAPINPKPKGNKLSAANAAANSRGTRGENQGGQGGIDKLLPKPLADVNPEILAQAGLGDPAGTHRGIKTGADGLEVELGMSAQSAKSLLAKLNTQAKGAVS